MAKVVKHFRMAYRYHRIKFERYVNRGEDRHWHDEYEIEFAVSGKGENLLSDRTLPIKRGTMYVARLRDFHEIKVTEPITYFRIILPKLCMPEPFLVSMIRSEEFLCTELSEEMTTHLENMFTLLCSRPYAESEEEIYMQECLLNVIIMLFTNEVNTNPADTLIPEHRKAYNVMLYIKDNFRQKHTLESVARANGMNPNYLNRILKKHMNTSVIQAVKHIRLEYAAMLCSATDMSTKEICENICYSCETNFVRDFRLYFSMPPMRYREYERRRQAGEEVNLDDYIEK